MKRPDPCAECGLSKLAGIHAGSGEGVHDHVSTVDRRTFGQVKKAIPARSSRPNRVQRYQESQEGMQRHREAVKVCEGPVYGLTTPCGTGADGIIEVHHRTGRGMGGGKDYGDLASLCRTHHREMDSDRPTARAVGLVKKRPPSGKTVPRSRF
jgi:hypothetical protein